AAAGGHRRPGLGQVRSATLPPVTCCTAREGARARSWPLPDAVPVVRAAVTVTISTAAYDECPIHAATTWLGHPRRVDGGGSDRARPDPGATTATAITPPTPSREDRPRPAPGKAVTRR